VKSNFKDFSLLFVENGIPESGEGIHFYVGVRPNEPDAGEVLAPLPCTRHPDHAARNLSQPDSFSLQV
jgi:hypothetical protein